jgi:hypothetical protein
MARSTLADLVPKCVGQAAHGLGTRQTKAVQRDEGMHLAQRAFAMTPQQREACTAQPRPPQGFSLTSLRREGPLVRLRRTAGVLGHHRRPKDLVELARIRHHVAPASHPEHGLGVQCIEFVYEVLPPGVETRPVDRMKPSEHPHQRVVVVDQASR